MHAAEAVSIFLGMCMIVEDGMNIAEDHYSTIAFRRSASLGV